MRVKDKDFEIFIDQEAIQRRIVELANSINDDYKDKNPLFVPILNGSFMFASDLLKNIKIKCQVSFIKISSYQATESTGVIQNLIGLNENINNRNIIIIEDIVDTGNTMSHLLESLGAMGTKSIEVATLLFKPQALKRKVNLKYIGFEIPNKFVVGYGLDYDGYGRNFPDIYQVVGF